MPSQGETRSILVTLPSGEKMTIVERWHVCVLCGGTGMAFTRTVDFELGFQVNRMCYACGGFGGHWKQVETEPSIPVLPFPE